MNKPKKNSKDINLDERYTPPYAIPPLLDLLNIDSNMMIWEPAAGKNDLVQSLIDNLSSEYIITHSTLNPDDGSGDFFNNKSVPVTIQSISIITNPPYSCKYEWIDRCYEITHDWALLLPVESLASSKLRTLFRTHGGISVLFMDSRIDYKKDDQLWHESSAQFPSCWIISGFGLPPNRMYEASIKDDKAEFKRISRIIG